MTRPRQASKLKDVEASDAPPAAVPARPRGVPASRAGLSGVIAMGRQDRLASPEGTRAQHSSRRTMRTASLAALGLLCACFAIAIGEQTASLTVKNLTAHTIVVAVEDQTFPRVPPGSRVVYQSGVAATVHVDVSYAPGQGVEGSVQRSFYLAPYHPPITSGTTVYFACTTGGTIVSPATGGPMTWQVTPDTLATR